MSGNISPPTIYARLDARTGQRVLCAHPCREEIARVMALPEGFILDDPDYGRTYVQRGSNDHRPVRLLLFPSGWEQDRSGTYYRSRRASKQLKREASIGEEYRPYRRKLPDEPRAERVKQLTAWGFEAESDHRFARYLLQDTAQAICPACKRVLILDAERLRLARNLPVNSY